MGNINPEIIAFQAAEVGEEVRSAIISLAQKLNTIVEQVVVDTGSDVIVGYKTIDPEEYDHTLANIDIAAVFAAGAAPNNWIDAPTSNPFTIITTRRSPNFNLQIAFGLSGKPNLYWRTVDRRTHEPESPGWITDDTPIDTTLSVSGAAADAAEVGDALDGIRNTFDNYVRAANAVVQSSLSMGRKANTTVGQNSVALGDGNEASGYGSFAEGGSTKATNFYAHSEGLETKATGENSHAEGKQTTAGGKQAHAEGNHSGASGDNSHAEGNNTIAYGGNSHAEGSDTFAQGDNSHAEGLGTGALSDNQHVHGKYNVNDQNGVYVSIVGNGTGSSARSNAATLDWNGNAWLAGGLELTDTATGTRYRITVENGSLKLTALS